MPRRALAGSGMSLRQMRLEHTMIAVKAAFAALALVGLKLLLVQAGLQKAVTLQLVSSLIGGVIFTLAIILSGVFQDFKESERLVSDVSSVLRRMHAEAALVASGERLAAMRAEIAEVATAFVQDLRVGKEIRTGAILSRIDRIDALLHEAARTGAASSQVRTMQVSLTTLTRAMDRLETIVETMFMRAGYAYAGTAVFLALGVLTFTAFDPYTQGLALHGMASFLLVGLLILIYDLDNPFSGAVHASIEQLEKVEAWLRKPS